MYRIYIFCDGGCRGNQFEHNVGGFGVVIKFKNHIKEFYGSQIDTTNNIMELLSCIYSLEVIKTKHIPIVVTMDSSYVIQGINEWIDSWLHNGWYNSQNKPVQNRELWIRLYNLKTKFEDIQFVKCKGHSTNEGNIRADELANIAMDEYKS